MKKRFNIFPCLLATFLLIPKSQMEAATSNNYTFDIMAAVACASVGMAGCYQYVHHIVVPQALREEAAMCYNGLTRNLGGRYPTTYRDLISSLNSMSSHFTETGTITRHMPKLTKIIIDLFYKPQDLQNQVRQQQIQQTLRFINGFFKKRIEMLKSLNSGEPSPVSIEMLKSLNSGEPSPVSIEMLKSLNSGEPSTVSDDPYNFQDLVNTARLKSRGFYL